MDTRPLWNRCYEKADKVAHESVNNPSTVMRDYSSHTANKGMLVPIVPICGYLNGGIH